MYSEKVMDHFSNPRNMGEIENASGVGTVGNAKCGDIMRIYLDIDEGHVIRECKFKTFGCGAAVATSSMATELVKGKTIHEAMAVTDESEMEALDGCKLQYLKWVLDKPVLNLQDFSINRDKVEALSALGIPQIILGKSLKL